MRQTSKILAEAVTACILFAVCVGCSFAEIATPETLAPSVGQAALPDAPSAVLAANIEFSSSRSEAIEPATVFSRLAPVTAQERFHRFVQRSFSPTALRGDLIDAAQAQFHHDWPGYGGGVIGFQKRYGATLAGHTTYNFFGDYLFPTLLHQDTRSPRLGSGSFWHRFGYAATRVVVTRNVDGNETFNSSLLLTVVASRSLANLYFPREQRGFSANVSSIQGALIDNVQGNLSREFMPDIRHFLGKHSPNWFHRVGSRLPF